MQELSEPISKNIARMGVWEIHCTAPASFYPHTLASSLKLGRVLWCSSAHSDFNKLK